MRVSAVLRGAFAAITLGLGGCASTQADNATATPAAVTTPLPPIVTQLPPQAPPVAPAPEGPRVDMAALIGEAQAQRLRGDLDGATQTLSQLVLAAPDDPRVLAEYGKTLLAKGRADDALAFLDRAAQLQPGDWTIFSAQGVAHDQKGNYPAAQNAYARALAINPGEPSVLSNKALSHMQTGDLDMAEQLLLQAAQAGDRHPRIARNLDLVARLKRERGVAAVQPAAMSAVPVDRPVESVPVTEPQDVRPVPTSASEGTLAALQADPTVVMARVPAEETPEPAKTEANTEDAVPSPPAIRRGEN